MTNSPSLFYSLLPAFVAVFFLFVGLAVLFDGWRKKTNVLFFFLCFTTFMWQGTWAALFQTKNLDTALDLVKLGYFFIIFLPTILYHFLAEISERKDEKSKVLLAYFIDCIFAVVLLSSDHLFVNGAYPYFWGYYPRAGIIHPLHVLQTSVFVTRGLWLVYKKSKESSEKKRNQLWYCVVGLLIYFFAAIDYLCNYGVEFYPPGIIFVSISLVIIGVAITKHNLLDIRVIITKGGAYLVTLILFAMGYLVGIAWPYFGLVSQHIDSGFLAVTILYGGVGVGLYFHRVQRFLQTYAEEKMLKGKYEVDAVMGEISKELLLTQDMHEVVDIITKHVSDQVQVKTVYEFSWMETLGEGEVYRFRDVLGNMKPSYRTALSDFNMTVTDAHPLIQALMGENTVIPLEKLPKEALANLGDVKFHKGSLFLAVHAFERLVSVLVLGPKLSEDAYTPQDTALFQIVLNQAIMVSDRIHYLTLQKNYKKSLEVAKQASVNATLATMTKQVSHEIRNPMQGLLLMVGGLQDKLTSALEFPLKNEVVDFVELVEKVVDHITQVTTSMMKFGYYKPSAPEPVDLRQCVEDSLGMIKAEAQKQGIQIVSDLPADLPLVKGKRFSFNQVFINVLRNGMQAISPGAGCIEISATVQDAQVIIGIKDTGCGMSDEDQRRFCEPFYTNKYDGIGLGMSVAFQIMHDYDGEIGVESALGHGTTVFLSFAKIAEQ